MDLFVRSTDLWPSTDGIATSRIKLGNQCQTVYKY